MSAKHGIIGILGFDIFYCAVKAVYHIALASAIAGNGNIADAVNEGVRTGYGEGFLRKSVVRDPLDRVNTGDNTPAMIYYDIVPGDKVEITIAPKGAGSENMSLIKMLKPSDGVLQRKGRCAGEGSGQRKGNNAQWPHAGSGRLLSLE